MGKEVLLQNFEGPSTYQITVNGKVDSLFINKLSGLSITHNQTHDKTISTLTGPVIDQSALNGILNTLFDYRYSVISVLKLD